MIQMILLFNENIVLMNSVEVTKRMNKFYPFSCVRIFLSAEVRIFLFAFFYNIQYKID